MKNFKIIFLIMLIMFVSGCKIRSDVVLNADGTVTESVKITESLKNSELTKEDYSNYLNGAISDNEALIKYGNYSYNKIYNEEVYGLEFYKNYDSICSYFQDTLFNQYIYKHINCEENDEFITIENDTPFISVRDAKDYSNPPDFSDTQLSITLPFRAYENNADEILENKYIWKFGESASNDKKFKLIISKNDLDEAYIKNQELIKRNKVLNVVKIIFGILGVIVAIIIAGFMLYKKYKENKLEY